MTTPPCAAGDDAAHRPAIAAHRLLANGRTVALLRPDAEVDWWCAPDIDSPPVLWSLLDAGGSAARFVGTRYAGASRDVAGGSARTVLAGEKGRIEVRDGMIEAGNDGGAALVRLVRALGGPLDVCHELRVGGFGDTPVPWNCDGSTATVTTPNATVCVNGGENAADGTTLRTRLVAEPEEWTAVTIAVGGAVAADTDALRRQLDDDDRARRAALDRTWLPRSHQDRAVDALAVLHACTYAPTGAVVASPTTSLPEAPGHDRQFDYRYTWLRDASLAVSVAALLGRGNDAEHYLAFVHRITGGRLVPSGPLVTVRGDTVPHERDVAVAGWAGSRPVRVGNDAAGQVQYDALGLLLEAVSVYLQTGGSLDDETWAMVRDVADRIADEDPHEVRPSNGIWEFRESAPLVDGDIGRWLVLDRALWIARLGHPLHRRAAWVRARDIIGARVIAAIDDRTGLLPQAYGQSPPRPDASALMAVIFGLLDRSDPRAKRLANATIEALDAAPYLYRYPPDATDGFSGREGAFIPVSAWAVTALAVTGQVDRARQRMDGLCGALPRLLPEEIDPLSGAGLGNIPVVWSHIELARALYVLDAAERRERYGAAGLWVWRIARYIRLRRSRSD